MKPLPKLVAMRWLAAWPQVCGSNEALQGSVFRDLQRMAAAVTSV